MFHQWMKYSARQVGFQACITCYNARHKPKVMPFPELIGRKCDRAITCLAECTLQLASGYRGVWSNVECVCPSRLSSDINAVVTPVTQVPEGVVHPFVLAGGYNLTDALKTNASYDE